MMMDDYDGQMIVGDLVGLKLPDIRLRSEEKPRKTLIQETCPDRGSNPGPLRDKRACYHLLHSGGRVSLVWSLCAVGRTRVSSSPCVSSHPCSKSRPIFLVVSFACLATGGGLQ